MGHHKGMMGGQGGKPDDGADEAPAPGDQPPPPPPGE